MTIVSKAAEYDPTDPDSSFVIDNGQELGQVEVSRDQDGTAFVLVSDLDLGGQHAFRSGDTVQAVDLAFAILRAAGATREGVAALVSGLPHEDHWLGREVHLVSSGEYEDYQVHAVTATEGLASDVVRRVNELLDSNESRKHEDRWRVSKTVPYFDEPPHAELYRVGGWTGPRVTHSAPPLVGDE